MTDWTVLVPIKPWTLSKSRLCMDPESTAVLARAFAQDVLDAVYGSRHTGAIIVISAEAEMRTVLREYGAVVLEDRPLLTPDPLNQAVMSGVHWAQRMRAASPLAVVPADLACMTTEDFDDALDLLGQSDLSYVPDTSGNGTTILASRIPAQIVPSYGPDSAHQHSMNGASVSAAHARVLHDIDTLDDLDLAEQLGVGKHTAAALPHIGERLTFAKLQGGIARK
ncbi:MAG: 2-phospho-L-lactate guanylyltransferase [Aeromicrobium sp.]